MYYLSPDIKKKTRKTILITGSARSGTSIFGKLFGSLERTEYFFEPPTLFSLFSIINLIPTIQAELLFETFIYEELLVGSLSGRNINLRRQDASSIRHIKCGVEIKRRLQQLARKREINTDMITPVLKIPDFVNRIATIGEKLKLSRFLIVVRDPVNVINSILRRGWLSDTSLRNETLVWPNQYHGCIPAPHWLPRVWLSDWDAMKEADRAALYYCLQTEVTNEVSSIASVIDYNQMINHPHELVEALCTQFGLMPGRCTQQVISTIKRQPTSAPFDLKILRTDLRERVIEAYAQTNAQAMKLN